MSRDHLESSRWARRFAPLPHTTKVRGGCAPSYSLHSPIVVGPPAASTASLASARLATCSTDGFLSLGTSPTSTLLSIVHCVRAGSKPLLTDQTQFLTSTSSA